MAATDCGAAPWRLSLINISQNHQNVSSIRVTFGEHDDTAAHSVATRVDSGRRGKEPPAFVISGLRSAGFPQGRPPRLTLWFAKRIMAPECDAPGYTRGGEISFTNSRTSLVDSTHKLTAGVAELTAWPNSARSAASHRWNAAAVPIPPRRLKDTAMPWPPAKR